MSALLFENFWLSLGVLIVAQFGLVAWWSWSRTPAARRGVWLGFAAMPVLLAVSVLVVTPRESIQQFCRELARAVESQDLESVRRFLADDFETGDLNAEEFVQVLAQMLKRYRIDRTDVAVVELERVSSNDWQAEVRAATDVYSADGFLSRVPTRWRIVLRSGPDQWTLAALTPVPVPPLYLRHIGDVLR
jgi:hypothetical protein